MSEKLITYGSTGDPERDGILSAEQQEILNKIQNEAADSLLDRLETRGPDDKFPMAAMATGIGKTRIEHIAVERTKRKNPKAKILFIAGTKLTLVEQSSNNLREYVESEDYSEDDLDELIKKEQKNPGFYSVGKFGIDKDVDVQIGTVQGVQSAFKNGRFSPDDFDLVIVDEAHNMGTPARKEMIGQFKNVLAFTATPRRSSGKMREPGDYDFEVEYSLTLPEAQEKRLLPPLIGMQLNTSELVDEIPTNLKGQIDYKKLEGILKDNPYLRPYIADRVAKIIKNGDKEYKTVVVVNFVWEAEELAQLLNDKGISVGVAVNKRASRRIHSEEIPAIDSIERYKLPQSDPRALQVLISPYVASEGFDAPATEVLVWGSPTDSDLRYTQYNGRLARRFPGKAFGVVVDCLYQTSQYGWNLNFAMWMKDNVRQLPNGLLYLGPEADIESLINLDAVKKMREESQRMDILDIQKGKIENLKDTDFAITQFEFRKIFIGAYNRLLPTALQVLEEIKETNPREVVARLSGTIVVPAVLDRELFIQKMHQKGVGLRDRSKEKDIEEIKDTDFAPTAEILSDTFRGGYKRVFPIAVKVLEEMQNDNPQLASHRKYTGGIITVATDRNIFIQKMLEKGVKIKDSGIYNPKFTDFTLTYRSLSVFRGEQKRVMATALLVAEEIKESDAELVKDRVNRRGSMVVVSDRNLFIQKMAEKGVILKDQDSL